MTCRRALDCEWGVFTLYRISICFLIAHIYVGRLARRPKGLVKFADEDVEKQYSPIHKGILKCLHKADAEAEEGALCKFA